MRHMPAVLIAAHLALLAVACTELLTPARDLNQPALDVPAPPEPPSVAAESLSVAELERISMRVDSLMLVVQDDGENVGAMAELAYLYLRHGWHEAAIGPLARAVQVAPGRDDLRYELRLVLKLTGLTDVDLAERARGFIEMVAMLGHGC